MYAVPNDVEQISRKHELIAMFLLDDFLNISLFNPKRSDLPFGVLFLNNLILALIM